MNKQNINTCPVCGTTIENGLCPKCGYLRLIFPEVVPETVKNQELERISKAKQVLQQSEKTICELKKSVKTHEESTRRTKDEISELESKIKKLASNNRNLESQLNDSRSKLNESNAQVERITRIVNSKNSEIENLQSKLADFAKRPARTNAFLVLIDEGEYSIIPVENEKHYYATGPGMELCPVVESKIKMLPVMTMLKAAFSIEKSDSGAYRLTDLSGNLNSIGSVSGNKFRLTQGVKINVKGSNLQLHFCINQQ